MAAFDLHIHSEYSSDGEFSVAELVGKCLGAQLTLFSLTDHNSVRGVGEAARLACERGIGFVPGIEIDCNYRGTDLHLLGYGIDWRSADFARLEEEVAAKVMASFGGMVDNLLKLGFSVDAEAVLAAAGGGLPTGELIAEVMLSDAKYHTPPLRPYMEGGARSDMPYINFYLDYFAQGRPAFVPVEYMDFRRAVELVRDNGGFLPLNDDSAPEEVVRLTQMSKKVFKRSLGMLLKRGEVEVDEKGIKSKTHDED